MVILELKLKARRGGEKIDNAGSLDEVRIPGKAIRQAIGDVRGDIYR